MTYRQTVVFEYADSRAAPAVGVGRFDPGPGVVVAAQFSDALRELEYLAARAKSEDRVAAVQYAHALGNREPEAMTRKLSDAEYEAILRRTAQALKPRFQWDGTLTGWPQWVRVPWLNVLYFPFWRTVNCFRRAARAWSGRINLVTDDELHAVTEELDMHPDGWHHPCSCRECQDCE